MFLAAAQYFNSRMADSQWLQDHFLSGITTTSTITNMAGMFILTKLQEMASYPKRITSSLILSTIVFIALSISTISFLDVGSGQYYGFLLTTVFLASSACALIQNGLFAYVAGFGIEEYLQGIFVGQGMAGFLPCVVQLAAVLSVSGDTVRTTEFDSSRAAFLYFLTAAGVSSISLVAFATIFVKHRRRIAPPNVVRNPENDGHGRRQAVSLLTLAWKLRWYASSVALCFAVTMFYPVFTQKVLSVRPPAVAGHLFQPDAFVPLGFLVWNCGDLFGRTLPLLPFFRMDNSPRLVFAFTISRFVFIPLYFLCNLDGKGAAVQSDFFYLAVVQLLFGLTNGLLSTTSMMAAPNWVEPEEREAAGSFMGLCIVGGLTVGSLTSFLVG